MAENQEDKGPKLVQVDKGLFIVEDNDQVATSNVRQIAKDLLRKVELPQRATKRPS